MTVDDAGSAAQLPRVFARLADALDPQYDVVDTMDHLVEAATTFTAATEAGLVLADESGMLHVVGSTSERTADVEEAELGIDEGPCLDSFRTGEVIETPDLLASADTWPRFVPIAMQRGFRAGYAVPLMLRGERLGALNLFFDRVDPLTDIDAAVSQALAEFATIGIVQHRALREHRSRAEQLQHALDSRVIIEQAKGALSFQRNVTIDEAFALMRRHARSAGARLHDIAEQIVARRLSL
ncbi:GAF and ANTAR domain-containing protein [Microbacterium sp. 3J1]|uniref:GAF and ANTAR domain-containing protein n=1 Tax=Microbacterium sp. 3J1 TaxID=861269 RepID=UPI000AC9AB47|nr:GAF and ANTAR domain-containing protein [Microbacterium sp. 3J1]